MISEIIYRNFRVLSDTTLKLSPFTLIVGPNGSGKSTAVRALSIIKQQPHEVGFSSVVSIDLLKEHTASVQLTFKFDDGTNFGRAWFGDPAKQQQYMQALRGVPPSPLLASRTFTLDPAAIAQPTRITKASSLEQNGAGLAGVLQDLRDMQPERFEELVVELRRWLPDFDNLLFQTPSDGFKSISLRTIVGRHAIPAADLSHGTLFALALLTIAYLPQPPAVIAIEEPDRGMHPRLLREVRDSLYRLAYPESFGDTRKPVQVIATTHSPYLVDLFKDHPEEVVLAQKDGLHAKLTRLIDQPNWEEIVHDAQLGELWYSGVLGGVPAGS